MLYAVGAPNDRRLDIDGMGLPGTGTATEVVAWINGHPDFADLPVDLSHERVVIVGNGNVALDVARILTTDPDELARTDIADHALAALRGSQVREVVIAARRGPAHSAFTLPELIGLTATVRRGARRRRSRAGAAATWPTVDRSADAQQAGDPEPSSATPPAPATRPRIRLAYQLTPQRVLGDRAGRPASSSRCTGTDEVRTTRRRAGADVDRLPRQADSRSAVRRGRRGGAQRRRPGDRPGDRRAGARQLRRRLDQARPDGLHRHQQVVCAADRAGPGRRLQRRPARPTRPARPAALDKLVRGRRPDVVDAAGWRAIDAAEIARGGAPAGRGTSSPRSPTCSARGRRRRRSRRCANGCWPDCAAEPATSARCRDRLCDLARCSTSRTGCRQRPVVAERVAHHAVAVTPELVLQRHDHGGAGVDRLLERGRRRR